MNYTKKYSGRSIFALMRAHPGAHCFVLIRFLFLMKSPHSTIFDKRNPVKRISLCLIYPMKVVMSSIFP